MQIVQWIDLVGLGMTMNIVWGMIVQALDWAQLSSEAAKIWHWYTYSVEVAKFIDNSLYLSIDIWAQVDLV